jgi:Zn-dependent protease
VSEPISLRSRPYGADELSPGYEQLRARQRRERGAGLHIALFLLTFASAATTNALLNGFNVFSEPVAILAGVPYAAALMAILLFHESGHYILARLHRVDASLPFFIPAPYPFFIGTFGAFIRMRTMPRDRRALFDVGAAGPWGGMLIALPVLAVGLSLSEVRPLSPADAAGGTLGESLLFTLLVKLVLGVSNADVMIELHPIALAGWVGLLVTALNLMPAGQLDGGHVVYAALGPRWHRRISLAMMAVLLALGLGGNPSWLVWAALLAVLGTRHPPLLDDTTPLDPRRLWGAAATALLFVVTFMPRPFSFAASPPPIPHDPHAIPVSAPAPARPHRSFAL